MATIQTGIAENIDASGDRARLDEVAKKLIKHKIILSEILKECVEEFSGLELSYIEKNCIIGDVRVDQIAVDQDSLDADSRIVGSDTEDASHKEGTVHFDLVFEAIVPQTGEVIGLTINVDYSDFQIIPINLNNSAYFFECQQIYRNNILIASDKPPYDVVIRPNRVFQISSRKNEVF